jgi:hypothetical protein
MDNSIFAYSEHSTVDQEGMRAFFGPHRDAVHVCSSLPQKDIGFFIFCEYLEPHIQIMNAHVDGKMFELVSNLDEIGSARREDRKPEQ